MKRFLGLAAALCAALWLTTGTARATAPTVTQSTNCSISATACTMTLGSNVTGGSLIVVFANAYNSSGSAITFTNCQYNSSNMTSGYNSGALGAGGYMFGVGLYATGVASVNAVICTFSGATQVDGVLGEVSGAVGSPTYQSATPCTTNNCTVTLNHNLLTSGNLGVGYGPLNGSSTGTVCGAGWGAFGTNGCSGTTTASANLTNQANGTHPAAWLAFADIPATGGGGGSSLPVMPGAGAYPGGRDQSYAPTFELLTRGMAWL